MESIVVVTAGDGDNDRAPLIAAAPENEIVPSPPSPSSSSSPAAAVALEKSLATASRRRLVSLDVFRGLTVALMILVDDAGGDFPSINHAPWFGVTLADFVMPFFLFGVGISVALVFKKPTDKLGASNKVILRTIKLFFLGVLLQGGYFHGRNSLTYGVDIDRIRWLGVLQRIAIGYFLAAMSEIWFVGHVKVNSSATLVKKYYIQWIVAVLLTATYLGLLYGIYVPNWQFEVPHSGSSTSTLHGIENETVYCGERGSLDPPCNAVGFIDRLLLGEKHLYQRPVYRRTKECSTNSPDYGPLPPNSPQWCLAPFDPEGLLSSLMASVTCFAGLHFGHLIIYNERHMERMLSWSKTSLAILACGFVVLISGMPFSKPLYTLSYMFLTAGVAGLVLTLTYFLVDFTNFRGPFVLLQWMGMNALIVFALAACELFPAAIQGFYWRSPGNNLVSFAQLLMQSFFHSKRWGTLVFVLLEILFWCLVAGFLHMKGIYIKL